MDKLKKMQEIMVRRLETGVKGPSFFTTTKLSGTKFDNCTGIKFV